MGDSSPVRWCLVQEHYGTTLKSIRLETERENLTFSLSLAKLTEEERSYIDQRLIFVENELLHLFSEKIA